MQERDISNKEPTHFRLSDHCRLVSGAKRAAVYDLDAGNIYSLNESAKEILSGSSDKHGFWEKLVKMGLAEQNSEILSPNLAVEVHQVGLEFMWLELTQRCNAKCIHCYASAGEFSTYPSKSEELSVGQWEQIIKEGAHLGCKQLQFIGGEPLLLGEIFDLAQVARDLNYTFIEIFTNGILLNEAKIQRTKDLNLQVAISLYSVVPEVHDGVTQIPGSFQKTLRALTMLKEAQIPTRIGIIAMRQNQDTLVETQSRLQEMGFDTRKVDVVRPTGRGGCAELLPTKEVVQTYALITKPDFSTSKEQFSHHQRWNSCWSGKIAVTSGGGIMPCIFARSHIVSDVRGGFEEAVNNEALLRLWKLTKDQVEGCQNCEYRYACHDCRPLAEDTTDNLYAQNPKCTYNPLTGEWLAIRKGGE